MNYYTSETDKKIITEYNKHLDNKKNVILGRALYECRKKLGESSGRIISQDEFANMIGIGRNTLINIEINPKKPKPYPRKINENTEKQIVDFLEHNFIEYWIEDDYFDDENDKNSKKEKQYAKTITGVLFRLEDQFVNDKIEPFRNLADYKFANTINSLYLHNKHSFDHNTKYAIENICIDDYNLVRLYPSNDLRFAKYIGDYPNHLHYLIMMSVEMEDIISYDEDFDVISIKGFEMLKKLYNVSKHTISFYEEKKVIKSLEYKDCLQILLDNDVTTQSINSIIYSSIINHS